MIIAGCARGVVLLLLVTSSFSRNLDDTSKTLDATVHDPALASVQHRPSGSVGGRLRRWNPSPENSVEHHKAASIGDGQRIDEEGLDGVNVISNVKGSKYNFFPHQQPPFVFPVQPVRPPFVLPVEPVRPPFVLPVEPVRPPFVFPPFVFPFQTTAAPTTGICQLLAANAGITEPLEILIHVQQCLILIGAITG